MNSLKHLPLAITVLAIVVLFILDYAKEKRYQKWKDEHF